MVTEKRDEKDRQKEIDGRNKKEEGGGRGEWRNRKETRIKGGRTAGMNEIEAKVVGRSMGMSAVKMEKC